VATDGRRSADITIRLASLEDLFRAPEPQQFTATGRLISGMEELILTLHGRRIPKRLRTTIVLAEAAPEPDQEALAQLIRRYCDLRLQEVELRMRGQGRQQRRALIVGGLLFVLGVAFAGEFTTSFWPEEVRTLLGDGIFLVIAWVGLWYPLDYLVFGRQPLLQDRKVLSSLRRAEVRLVRERTGAAEVQRPAEALQGSTDPARRARSR
jgi:hypothetical protein